MLAEYSVLINLALRCSDMPAETLMPSLAAIGKSQ